jgi:hypothetical protein
LFTKTVHGKSLVLWEEENSVAKRKSLVQENTNALLTPISVTLLVPSSLQNVLKFVLGKQKEIVVK